MTSTDRGKISILFVENMENISHCILQSTVPSIFCITKLQQLFFNVISSKSFVSFSLRFQMVIIRGISFQILFRNFQLVAKFTLNGIQVLKHLNCEEEMDPSFPRIIKEFKDKKRKKNCL